MTLDWLDVSYVTGYVSVTHELLYMPPPEYGPPLPDWMEARRRFGGHPVGVYRKAAA